MSSSTADSWIPKSQLAATVPQQGGPVVFVEDYPVPQPGKDEVLVKVLYTGISTPPAAPPLAPTGKPITAIKLPHVGGHEGVGRIVAFGPDTSTTSSSNQAISIGSLVEIRFLSRVCNSCEYCATDREQYCLNSKNHLHHEDGSFQEYCVLDTKYLTVLPEDIDVSVVGPVLCAGVTAYKAVKNAHLKRGEWLCVIGAGGGLGHFAVQYGLALGAQVIGIDGGDAKQQFIESMGAKYLDFTKSTDLVADVVSITNGGVHAAVVTSGHPAAFDHAVDVLRIGGVLSVVGIPPGDVHLRTPIATIVIKGLRIFGNLVGSMTETVESVEMVRNGKVKPHVRIRPFRELPDIYDMLERGDIPGRIVLKVGD